MFGLGMGELALVLLVAFLVLGPTQVPKLMRDLGKTIRDFRRVGEDVRQQLVLDDEIRKPLEELREAMVMPLDVNVPREDPNPAPGAARADGTSALPSPNGQQGTPTTLAKTATPAEPDRAELDTEVRTDPVTGQALPMAAPKKPTS